MKLVNYPTSLVKDAVGTYRFDGGFTVRFAIEGPAFMVRFANGDGCRLVTEDRRVFFCEGDVDHFEFVRDAAGAVSGVLNDGTDRGTRIK